MKKIIEFQRINNLSTDGIIGKKTLDKFLDNYDLSKVELANFLGQTHHETSGFTRDTESLNYSAKGLKSTFLYYKKNPKEAWLDGRTWIQKANQETIANKVYWDKNRSRRYRLGNKNYGDGWKYIGRGSGHTTGLSNYSDLALHLGDLSILNKPELVATKYFWESGLFYFNKNKVWKECGTGVKDITKVTELVNGGNRGLEERISYTRKYLRILQA